MIKTTGPWYVTLQFNQRNAVKRLPPGHIPALTRDEISEQVPAYQQEAVNLQTFWNSLRHYGKLPAVM